MTARLLSAFDLVTNFVFTAFKKAMWTVVVTAAVASFVTFVLITIFQALVP